MKPFYLITAVVGTILPYAIFLPFLAEHGFNLPLILAQIVQTRVSAFAWADVLISAVVLIAFILNSPTLTRGQRAACIIGTLTVGVSLGLPLLLYCRAAAPDEKTA
jgi:hypothetical protein